MPGKVGEILSFVTGLASEAGVTPDKIARLELAIEEWATNVCRHAYRSEGGTLSVAVRSDGEAFFVELGDDGSPFDPTAAKDPDVSLPLADRTPGGLGLMLMRRMVDAVHYRREGDRNILTLAVRS
jgi:serine/threonine-protein kinase RsbW